MNKKKIEDLVLFSALSAIILALGLTPQLGFIIIPGFASLQVVFIVVLIGVIFLPLGYVLGLGFMFGITSLMASYLYASSLFDYAFQNPITAIVPRVIFALVAYYLYFGLKKLFKKIKYKKVYNHLIIAVITVLFVVFVTMGVRAVTKWPILPVLITAIVVGSIFLIIIYTILNKEKYKNINHIPTYLILSTFAHSILVLITVALLKPSAYESTNVFGTILLILSTNSFTEALLAMLIATPIIYALITVKEREGEENDFNVWCRKHRVKTCD